MKTHIKKSIHLVKSIGSKGFFHLLSANVLIQILSFASQLFVADILAPSEIGIIKFIQTLIGIFSTIGGLGLSASTLKICSEKNTTEYKQKVFGSALSFTILGTLISYFLVVFFILFRIIPTQSQVVKLAPIAFIPIILNNIFSVFVSYYQARKKIKQLSYFTISNKILSIILIISLTFYFGIYGYYYAMNIGLILMVTVLLISTKKDISLNFEKKKQLSLFKKHRVYSLPSFLANLLAELTVYTDILFLNFFLKDMDTEIGYYSFALTLTIIIRVLPATVQQISNPYFSEKGNNKTEIELLYKKYSKLLILVIVITFLGVILFVPFGIKFVFTKYIPSIKYFIPLALAWSIRQYNQITAAALFGLGKINYTTYSQGISLIFNILVIPIFLLNWQIIDVAYGMILCSIFNILITFLFYKKAIK